MFKAITVEEHEREVTSQCAVSDNVRVHRLSKIPLCARKGAFTCHDEDRRSSAVMKASWLCSSDDKALSHRRKRACLFGGF